MKTILQNQDLEIIAGPCSITLENAKEILHEISTIQTPDHKRAIYGTRVVGLKSRTALDQNGRGMGMDCEAIQDYLRLGEEQRRGIVLPSVMLASEIVKKTGLCVATEIMIPDIQLPFYAEQKNLDDHLMIWNPSVDQLGWHIAQMAKYVNAHKWNLGIKNGKFLGDVALSIADHPQYSGETSLEKTWTGLLTYANSLYKAPILIHRGVDVAQKGHFRNAPVHEIVKRIKAKLPEIKIYFDPSHSYGPKLKDQIIPGTIEAMKLKVNNQFLYSGILIETGTSPSDTLQHITIKELQFLVDQLSEFRHLTGPINDDQREHTRIYDRNFKE